MHASKSDDKLLKLLLNGSELQGASSRYWTPSLKPTWQRFRYSIAGLITVLSMLGWWFSYHSIRRMHMDASLDTDVVLRGAVADGQAIRRYNLTMGARWMNLGISPKFLPYVHE